MPSFNVLLLIAAAPQLAIILGVRVPALFLLSIVAVTFWCLRNRTLPGVLCVAIGASLNALVMALHQGAMPVHASTFTAYGQMATPGALLLGSKDVVIQSSPLGLLADWLVIPLNSQRVIAASPGDLLILAGIVYWLLVGPSQRKEQLHAQHLTTYTARSWFPRTSRAE
jgi:hypothetical protein